MTKQITARITNKILYEGDHSTIIECVEAAITAGADLRGSNLRNADLRQANLRHANLRHADLRRTDLGDADLRRTDLGDADLGQADLRQADLRGSNLRNADLRRTDLRGSKIEGATYGKDIPISVPPLCLSGLAYDVLIFDNYIKCGCELHSIKEWEAMDKDDIEEMGGKAAVKMWRQCGDTILRLAQIHQAQCAKHTEGAE